MRLRQDSYRTGGEELMETMNEYEEFLRRKRVAAPVAGIMPNRAGLHPWLFGWQADIVEWALRRGRAALFEECGLGKTVQQLEWGREIAAHTGRPTLILAPLAVNAQTVAEGEKIDLAVHSCRSQADVRDGVNVANYEMLEHFEPSRFGGIVLDESSLLKSYMGATKRRLVESFAHTDYRLCCTATPAPNDHMEIGNHSEFLGIMPSNEMISRWFINDTMNMGKYRLKGHAERSFWDWVATWAVSMRRPSDLGYPDDGFILPPLNLHQEVVDVDETEGASDALFRASAISATSLHTEMRLTCSERSHRVAELVNDSSEAWVVWCNTNYEADALTALIPDAIEVRGDDSIAEKERRLTAFGAGQERVIITKPTIAGFGLNWQHCHNAAFVGLSYSFEQLYQAIRRIYRFGQLHPVHVHIVTAKTEGAIVRSIQDKMEAHQRLMDGMNSSRRKLCLTADLRLADSIGSEPIVLPAWLQAA